MALAVPSLDAEWLEADGEGGFASGTVGGARTRRYHALLLTSTTPPTGRMVLVNGVEAAVLTPHGSYALSSQRYAPDVLHPDGASRIASFTAEPWPTWIFALEDGTRIRQEVLVSKPDGLVTMAWSLEGGGSAPARLSVRPLLSGRDTHALHHENPAFRFDASLEEGGGVRWSPYPGVPSVRAHSNGSYRHDPLWYRSFLYTEERARGLDHVEDLASPGEFTFDLRDGEAVLGFEAAQDGTAGPYRDSVVFPSERERSRRGALGDPLLRAADAYIVRRGGGKTIVAGYPWFTDWGRDTFISLRGLCHSTGRWRDAHAILLAWAGSVSEGMLPNRFVESGDAPEYNSVDASLWFVVAVHEHLRRAEDEGWKVPDADRDELLAAVQAIVTGYAAGTRHGIRMDHEGLLRSGEPGVQLTWMDAKVGEWVVTPRTGKPVEVQALWLNALRIAAEIDPEWREAFQKGLSSFRDRFWNEERGCLYDVVDVDHVPGVADPSLRPNQLFAVGGLPFALLDGDRARSVVDVVEHQLMTPMGPRSLAPDEDAYAARYEGGVLERDGSYHQGTVWPWLIGAFVDAWIRVRGGTEKARVEAGRRFVAPLLQHRPEAGIGHVSEIADAESPFTPRGCPFQAWSLGELIRARQATEVLPGRSAAAELSLEAEGHHARAEPLAGPSRLG